MTNPINEHYVKLCSNAEREAKSLATTVLTFFDNVDSLHHYLNSLFYNHSVMDNDQFAIYLGLMYEIVGCEMPENLDYYIVIDQETNVFFNCYLATLLTTIINEMGGYQLCPAT
ncbi:hypothetical protein [Acetoanaerobium sticklandii]|uniref:hypothetical protein n=1 Tax=Acetoanaerobium sticklandii TaxID=1511 RepID=UPI003A90A47D